MKKIITIISLLALAGTISAGPVGHWSLNDNFSNDVAGSALSLVGTTQLSYANDTIGGSAAKELSFPAFSGYTKLINIPNEASQVPSTNYTIVMDVKFPTIPAYVSLLWFGNQNTDGDFFIKSNGGGIGIGGKYVGTVNQGTWYRIALAAYASGNNIIWSKYIDGSLVGTQVLDNSTGRYSINDELKLFVDNTTETSAGKLNSLALFSSEKNSTFISGLGGASAGGISTTASDLIGLWNFNDSLINDVASSKPAFLTKMGIFSTEKISGSTASVFAFPAFDTNQWIKMPNGSGTVPTKNYTLLMDVKLAAGWSCFYNNNTNNDTDGNIYLNTSHQIGLGSSNYGGTFNDDTWYRFAITVKTNGTAGSYDTQKWLNGSKVQGVITYSGTTGSRFPMQSYSLLFADNDNETHMGAINSVVLWAEVLNDSTIQSYGGPSAEGIPIPEPAFIIMILASIAGLLIRK